MKNSLNTHLLCKLKQILLIGSGSILAAQLTGCLDLARKDLKQEVQTFKAFPMREGSLGALSGKPFHLPDVNIAPMPAISSSGVIFNGQPIPFEIPSQPGQPDVRSFKRKFGLLIPVTNTSMEHELWSMIFNNQGPEGLDGIGLHTTNIITPKPQLRTEADLDLYKQQFLGGLDTAIDQALLAQPQYLIMGMSLEHILHGITDP